MQLVSVTITILGTLIVYLPSKFTYSELKLMKAITIPLAIAVLIGLSDTASKRFINYSGGDQSFLLTLASIVAPIAATSGAIVVLLAVLLLDEDLNWRTAIGLLATFVGIISISLTSRGIS